MFHLRCSYCSCSFIAAQQATNEDCSANHTSFLRAPFFPFLLATPHQIPREPLRQWTRPCVRRRPSENHQSTGIVAVEKSPTKPKKPKQFSKDKLAIFLAEFVGTGILVFLGCMGCIGGVNEQVTTHHLSSLSFGLVVMMVIQVRGSCGVGETRRRKIA